MDCERCKESLSETAAGALAPECEAALRPHLEACAACRAALEMGRRLYAAIDRGVAASVAAGPSAAFEARVRHRIEAEPLPARPWFFGLRFPGWAPAAAAALALMVLVLILFERREPRPLELADSAKSQPAEAPAAGLGSSSSAESALSLNPAASAPIAAPANRSRRASRNSQSAKVLVRELEVLVPPGEQAAVLQLYAALQSRRVGGASLVAAPATPPAQLSIEPIEISRLEIGSKLETESRQ